MSIRFNCPTCQALMTVDDSYAGKKGKCPKCDQIFQIPASGEPEPVPESVRPATPSAAPTPAAPPPPFPKEDTSPDDFDYDGGGDSRRGEKPSRSRPVDVEEEYDYDEDRGRRRRRSSRYEDDYEDDYDDPRDRYRGGYGPRQGNGLAVGGFVCSLVGLVLFMSGPITIILAIIGVSLSGPGLKVSEERQSGKGLAIAGIVMGIIALGLAILVIATHPAYRRL